MSEAFEKVNGIRHLPLFPLPLVLLPNEVLPLHIFEPRYRQLFADIEKERNLFGVVTVNTESPGIDKPARGSIGCVAEVRETEALPDGRSNIVSIGVIRFRLLGYVETGEPYFVGDVEFFEDEAEDESVLQPLADEVFELFERVAKAAFQISGSRGRFPEIPRTTPELLSFLITAAFNLENEMKYAMLEMTQASLRLEKLREILQQAVTKMEESADIHEISRTNGHARKDIGL